MKDLKKIVFILSPIIICLIFFVFYTILALIKHNHFQSGYDLAIIDQIIWKYSCFKAPITTVHAYPLTSIFTDHLEFIYILISPIYWIFNDVKALITLQTLAICSSAFAVYLLARKKGINYFLSLSLLVSYLMFYGIQFAIWSDVHSLVFAVSFLAWFLYFVEIKNFRVASLFFVLSIICKEDIALLTFLISGVLYITNRDKKVLVFSVLSILYLFSIFFIYFPHFTKDGYRFQNSGGLLSNINLGNMYNTTEKQNVLWYSVMWYGFLPLLSPLYFLVAVADLAHYFVLGSSYVTSAQGLFLHYRSSLALLLVWPTIITLARFKRLNTPYFALYILLGAVMGQYMLHLPLSYLAKKWFWTQPASVQSINKIIVLIPQDASVVSQNNITPHLTHREMIFTLWPEKKHFARNSPCGQPTCNWFHWAGKPQYLVVDTSTDWDARYWLTNRDEFIEGLENMEKAHIIKKYKQFGTSFVYTVTRKKEVR